VNAIYPSKKEWLLQQRLAAAAATAAAAAEGHRGVAGIKSRYTV